MEKSSVCFPFLKVPGTPLKPRSSGLNIVSDRGLAIQEARNLMETSAELIDYIKFTSHPANIGRHPEEWIKAKIDIYHSHQIKAFPGGIPFELAVLQGQVEPYMERLKELGFDGVEISEDVITPLPSEVRLSYIGFARKIGLEAFTEIGKKDPTAPLDPDEAIAAIHADLEEGAKKVTIENSDLVLLAKEGFSKVEKIINAVGIEKVVLEVGPHGWPQVATSVIRTFGRGVSLENFGPDQLAIIDAMRRGMHRNVNYEFLSVRHGIMEDDSSTY